jgi:O-succinylbenzoic acid--CoA ligase
VPLAPSLDLTERDLVAASLPAGPIWRDVIRDAGDAGAAVLPIDARLPRRAAERLVRLARPTVAVTAEGGTTAVRRLDDGVPVDTGVALVVATSGTTGEPKLVELERHAIEAAVSASAEALDASRDDGWLLCLSPSHVAGMLVLFRGLLLGAPVDIHPSFDPKRIVATRSEFVSIVPTMLVWLLDAGVDVGAFKSILVGGGHLRSDVRERAERAGARIVETYGLTESCGGVVYEGVPFDGVGVRIHPEGVIELAGPTLMKGYRFDPTATADAFTADGWLKTRDAGTLDPDGRLHVAGRIDDAITTGGETVWPIEVESVLALHRKVADVSVIGRPDPEWGERVVAVVVPRDPSDAPTLDELRALATDRLARYKAPRELEIVARLPRTTTGKVRRPAESRG